MSSTSIKQKPHGFTIVELMIVMVVIAILAAITIVAYTGVQNRAHDAAVQNDLRQLASMLNMYHAQYGNYPTSREQHESMSEEFGPISVSKGSYTTMGESFASSRNGNLIFCVPQEMNDFTLAIIARSKSGRILQYGGTGTGEVIPGDSWDFIDICTLAGTPVGSVAGSENNYHYHTSEGWRDWVR